MELKEIAEMMLEYLNESFTYQDFLNWAEDKGCDKDELDESITNELE